MSKTKITQKKVKEEISNKEDEIDSNNESIDESIKNNEELNDSKSDSESDDNDKLNEKLNKLSEAQIESKLEELFHQWNRYGKTNVQDLILSRSMSNWTFCKLILQSKLHVTRIDIDLIFAKVKTRGIRSITFNQFMHGLDAISQKLNESLDEVRNKIINSGSPKNTKVTKTQFVRHYDDRKSWTGTAKKGGIKVIDNNASSDYSYRHSLRSSFYTITHN